MILKIRKIKYVLRTIIRNIYSKPLAKWISYYKIILSNDETKNKSNIDFFDFSDMIKHKGIC